MKTNYDYLFIIKGGSINYHRYIKLNCKDDVLLSLGLFSAQSVSSFSRYARITPSFTCTLTLKIASKYNKANL